MTYTVTEHNADFNIYDILDLLQEYAVPRSNLDECGHDFIENLSKNTSSPSWRMVVGFLNRHVFINSSGEHTLRISFYVKEEKHKRNPTRPFVLTQGSNISDLIKWSRRAGNQRMSFDDIVSEMNSRFGGHIRLEAKNDNHGVQGLVNIIEEGRIQNFDNLCRYISVIAPNVGFKILAMKSNEEHRTLISNDFSMEWGINFTGSVNVFSSGHMTPYSFTDDENEAQDSPTELSPPAPPVVVEQRYDNYWERVKNDINIRNWIDIGLLDHQLKPTSKLFSHIIKDEIGFK